MSCVSIAPDLIIPALRIALVESTERLDRRGDRAFVGLGMSDVTGDGDESIVLGQGSQPALVAIQHDDAGAPFEEQFRRGQADTGGSARDERHFPVFIRHEYFLPFGPRCGG